MCILVIIYFSRARILYNNIITNLQKEIEDIKNNQEKLINKNKRVELIEEISDSIMFNASENEIIKITEEKL